MTVMKLLVAKTLLSALALTSTAAFACTPITQADVPITITSGGTYCLTENIALGSPINIQAYNVTLDLQGNTLSGTRLTTAVVSTANSVVIKNGTIASFVTGVSIYGQSHASYVHSNTVENIDFVRIMNNPVSTNYWKRIGLASDNK